MRPFEPQGADDDTMASDVPIQLRPACTLRWARQISRTCWSGWVHCGESMKSEPAAVGATRSEADTQLLLIPPAARLLIRNSPITVRHRFESAGFQMC